MMQALSAKVAEGEEPPQGTNRRARKIPGGMNHRSCMKIFIGHLM